MSHDQRATDWEAYYRERKGPGSPTRTITKNLILQAIAGLSNGPPQHIIEFGGGDSCFYSAFQQAYPQARYVAADNSEVGIAKFRTSNGSPLTEAIQIDLLSQPIERKGDLVYSVGLIEHFDREDTARMIKAHFDAALPGGLVLITYPTPTLPYRVIRGAAEALGIWKFHDERPLLYDEVAGEMQRYGTIVYRKMNWFIGLTQEILIARVGT